MRRSYATKPTRALKPIRQTSGHLIVNLSVGNVRTRSYIHRLVAAAFLETDGPLVRHLDGDPSNNHVANLSHGTSQDNWDDMKRHGRFIANHYPARSHCKHGHEFTPENTRIRKDSGRECRTCRRAIGARWEARQRG